MTATFNARRARASFCNRFFVRIGLGLSVALLAATTYAADRLALVIGNDAYKNVDPLRNARNDARLMATTLREAKFDVTAADNLDRTRLWAEIDRFKNRIKKGDEVVFYFAGHGVQIGSNQLLLPVDIAAQSDRQVERDGVPLIEIQDALKDARTAVFVIDACRDNPFPKQGTRTIGGTRGLIPPDVTSGQIVILSAGRNQKALDNVPGQSSQNGLFTHELVQVIKSGNPEVRTAFEQVKQRVDDKAKRNGHEQRPSVVSDLNGNFYFFIGPGGTVIVNPAPAPQREATRIQSADEIEQQSWEDAQKANTVAALEAYLAEYPKGRFASRARIRVAALAPQQSARRAGEVFGTAAAAYPEKPITVVVPFAAGGPTDVFARTLSQAMSSQLKASMIIENVGGAGGTIGAGKVARAAGDGYTLLFHHIGMATAPSLFRKLDFKPLDDFIPIGAVVDVPMTLIAKPQTAQATVNELIAYIRANKGKINLANAGIGSASHLCGLLLQNALKTDLTTVPFSGAAPAMSALIGGNVDIMCDQTTNTTGQIKGGKVKAVAVTSKGKLANFPDLPPLANELPGFEAGVWHILYAPKNTPAAVVTQLQAALQAAIKDPAFAAKVKDLGAEIMPADRQTSIGARALLSAEIGKWAPIIRAAGAYAD